MRTARSTVGPQRREVWTGAGAPMSLALTATTFLAAPLALFVALVPAALVLPLFGITAVVNAGLFAAVSWWRGESRDADHLTWWDIAGALAFIGIAAVLLSQPEDVLPLLGHH
jgi:hypothetical protein